MLRALALARLGSMTAAATAPTLSDGELNTLLDMHQVADSAGFAPGATDYVPTYDFNRAAAEGWRWKAARVAGQFDFNADGATYNRSQKLDMCEKMIRQYQRRIVGYAIAASPIAAVEVEDE